MKKSILREYAKLIVRCGVNVQKGQEVLINCGLDQPEFVAMVVEEAYKAKAGLVTVNWNYQPLTRLHAEYQEIESLGAVYEWEKAKLQQLEKQLKDLKFEQDNFNMSHEKMQQLLKAEKPDLVITDVKMPRMNGLELAKRLARR